MPGYIDYASRKGENTNLEYLRGADEATDSEGGDLGGRRLEESGGESDGREEPRSSDPEQTTSGTEYVDYAANRQKVEAGTDSQGEERAINSSDPEWIDYRRGTGNNPATLMRAAFGFNDDPQGYYHPTRDLGPPGPFEHGSKVPDADGLVREHAGVFYDPGFAETSAGESWAFEHNVPNYGHPTLIKRAFTEGFQIGSFLITAGSFNLLVIISIVHYIFDLANPFTKWNPRVKRDLEWERRIPGERFSSRPEYYANFFGYECENHDVETDDGFILKVNHLISKKHRKPGFPVLLQHGILSSSTTWVVNEERSLAFWLLERGYDVWLGNVRTNFKMPHRHFPRSDPRYWAWGIKEIGNYDCTATISYIYEKTGSKVAYVGHSQGTGTMFLALSKGQSPEIGNKMSCFVALGPSVFAGRVLLTFPFSLMRKFTNRTLWALVFGVREFIPVMGLLQAYLPSWLFGHFALPVFYQLFGFTDRNWVPRQIPKFFRCTPVPNSSELLYYYMANFSHRGCIFDPRRDEPWFPPTFPPLTIVWGSVDTLVAGAPLVERIRKKERHVKLLRAVEVPNYDHTDLVWAVDAPKEVFEHVRATIEQTRPAPPAAAPARASAF